MFYAVNIRARIVIGRTRVYCGRPKAGSLSPLGNPFTVEKYGRDGCIAMFKKHMDKDVKIPGAFRDEMIRLYRMSGDVELACFCKPKSCHCDHLADFLNQFS